MCPTVVLKSWLIVVDLDKEGCPPAKDLSRIRTNIHNYLTCNPKYLSPCCFLLVAQNIRPGTACLTIDDLRDDLIAARVHVNGLKVAVIWAGVLHTQP